MFWQAKAEIEEQVRAAMLDVGSGALAGQAVAYFIIICTASTLFVHHQNINTALMRYELWNPWPDLWLATSLPSG
jgi:hypothetical protein